MKPCTIDGMHVYFSFIVKTYYFTFCWHMCVLKEFCFIAVMFALYI